MFTKNPLRIAAGVVFALWFVGCLFGITPIAWGMASIWFCLSVRMFTHRWPTKAWRDFRNR